MVDANLEAGVGAENRGLQEDVDCIDDIEDPVRRKKRE